MTAPAHFVTPRATLGEVLECMMRERVSSVFVHPDGTNRPARPDEVGIVTERDVLRAIANSGVSVLAMPAAEFASRPLAAISAEAFCYLAIARMRRLDVRHLGVTDSAGFVEGALSARDLLRLRAEGAISLGDEIEEAAGVPDLARAWSKLPQVAAALLADGASGRQIAAVISDQICALTAQAAVFAERRMRENGHGSAPCPYAVAVLGSAGRGESLLALDQDNALVFAEGAEGGPEDIWFGRLGGQIADILHEAGVPYCKGGVMAKNADWRGSVATWRRRIEHWVGRSDPEDLLAVDIFFDMLGVHGDFMLADGVWSAAFDAAKGQAVFAKLLADTAGEVAPGLTMFGRIRTEQGRIDLKRAGLFGIVSTARSLAVCHHVVERSTPARLSGVSALGLGGSDLEALQEAQVVFLDLIVAQQIKDIERGITLSNAIEVRALHRRDRERLLAALGAVRHLSDLTRDLLFRS